jgi:hypothetical protein
MFAPKPGTNEGTPTVLLGPEEPMPFFRQHDFTCVRNVVPADVALAAGPVLTRLQKENWGDGPSSTQARQGKRSLTWTFDEAPPELRQLLLDPALLGLVYEAHGTQDVRFAAWVIFHRPGGEMGTFWHSDAGHMAFGGNVVQFWMPLAPLPGDEGLMFVGDLGDGPTPITFGNLRPGDMTMHRQRVLHAGQTYPEDTIGVSFITYADGVILEDHPMPVFHGARLQMIDRLFPGATFGDRAEGPLTPLLRDLLPAS